MSSIITNTSGCTLNLFKVLIPLFTAIIQLYESLHFDSSEETLGPFSTIKQFAQTSYKYYGPCGRKKKLLIPLLEKMGNLVFEYQGNKNKGNKSHFLSVELFIYATLAYI